MEFIHDKKELIKAMNVILQQIADENDVSFQPFEKYYEDVLLWMIDHKFIRTTDNNGKEYLGINSEYNGRSRTLGVGALAAIYYICVPASKCKPEWEEITQKLSTDGPDLYLIGNLDQRLKIDSKWLITQFVLIHKH